MRNTMHRIIAVFALIVLAVSAPASAEQTIVFLRHAEKPAGGYGQITC
jgi:hypothetical protein